MQHYTYLLVDILSVFVPVLFSFHKKVSFYKQWKQLMPVMIAVATFFIAWDIYYTHKKVWSFNEEYIIGVYFFNLPVEEILFFFCIPFSCTFSYYVIKLQYGIVVKNYPKITIAAGLLFLVIGFINFTKLYTAATFILLGVCFLCIALLFSQFNMNQFLFVYCILLVPFFIVNGILTGSFLNRVIVSYDDTQNVGIRLLTIPFEDIFYGMAMVLMNIAGVEFLLKRKNSK